MFQLIFYIIIRITLFFSDTFCVTVIVPVVTVIASDVDFINQQSLVK